MLPSISDITTVLKTVDLPYRIGVAGSYARNTATETSDIDVVVDTDMLDIPDIECIKSLIKSQFNKDTDVICLQLLREEDEHLDRLALNIGVNKNSYSAYKSILREVIWCE